jgi:hypothetical protein
MRILLQVKTIFFNMNWYTVRIEDKTGVTGAAYARTDSEKQAEELGRNEIYDALGMQGISYIDVNEMELSNVFTDLDSEDAKIQKQIKLASGYNEAFLEDGTRVTRSSLEKLD